jgi:uncharacterized membrane protein YcaP (DUF421 family)
MTLPDLGDGPLEVAVRTAIVYVALVVFLRLAGKRQIGQLSIIDLVTLLVISDAVQNSMVGQNTTLAGGLIAALTLITLDRLLGNLRDRFPRLRRAIEGEPALLIRDGKMLREAMRREGLTEDELLSAIRQHGVARIEDVKMAILEVNGAISVIPDDGASVDPLDHRPATS